MIYNTIKQYDVNDTGDAFNPYLFSTSSSSSSSSTLLSTTTTASITVRINNETENVLDQQIPFDCQEEFFDVENFTDLNFPGKLSYSQSIELKKKKKITSFSFKFGSRKRKKKLKSYFRLNCFPDFYFIFVFQVKSIKQKIMVWMSISKSRSISSRSWHRCLATLPL